MAVSVIPLPLYPSSKARTSLSPSQQATLNQTIASSLAQTLSLPQAQCDSPATQAFIASYAKDQAQIVHQALIWAEDQHMDQSKLFTNLSRMERAIRQSAFRLAERLAVSGSLDVQILIDLSVAYGSTNPTRLRALFSSAFSQNSGLFAQVQDEAVPAFTDLLSAPAQGLYGLRKTAHIIVSLLRSSPPDIVRLFARSKPFMLALGRAYDHGLSMFAQSYGGLRERSAEITLDQSERIFLETKVDLIDGFHILMHTLLSDVAAVPSSGPALAAQCEPAFEVIFALLELPPSHVETGGSRTTPAMPFLNQPLLADYQHAYDLSRILRDTLRRADEARTELLESALQSLDTPSQAADPGVLKLLLRSSGVPPGIDNRGKGPSSPAVQAKGKAKATDSVVQNDPAIDAAVSQVLDILPDQPPAYVRFLLAHADYPYHGDAERLIGALLEGTVPVVEEVEATMNATAITHAETEGRPGEENGRKEGKEEYVYTKERRNVFDEEKMDSRNVRIGKKSEDTSTVLQDRAYIDQMKADILRRAEAISDDESEDEYGYVYAGEKDKGKAKGRDIAFEEELDEVDAGTVKVRDGDESELDGPDTDGEKETEGSDEDEVQEGPSRRPEIILELAYIQDPKLFDRDGQTRRSKARTDLRTQTGWTDEQIEGWKIMLDRNPNKDKILGKHEFTGNKQGTPLAMPSGPPHLRGDGRGRGSRRGGGGRGRGSRGGGRGGGGGGAGGEADGGSARDRAWKDKNKASRANHNRKRGHDKKMARAGGPS